MVEVLDFLTEFPDSYPTTGHLIFSSQNILAVRWIHEYSVVCNERKTNPEAGSFYQEENSRELFLVEMAFL